MAKVEEKPLEGITPDDIVTIGSIATIISTKMKKIVTTYSDPMEYAQEVLKRLKHNHHIVANFISFNLIHMDPQSGWASPGDFKAVIKKITERENTIDTTSMLSSAMEKAVDGGNIYVDPKVINKALELLKKDSIVIHIKKKKEMESLIGRKIKDLRGRPSFYKQYFSSINLKKVMSNPAEVRLVIDILKKFGLIRFLALQLEAEYYVLKSNKSKVYDIEWAYLKTNEEQIEEIEKIKVSWQDFKAAADSIIGIFDGIEEDKLKILFKKIANLMTEHQIFYPYILSLALSRNSIDAEQ
jgi:hypothetical protein